MLIGFEVENFLSIKGRQELNMIADSDREMEHTHCINPGTATDLRLLKSAVIYGANASGKSNLIKAILYMRDVILTSSSGEKISESTAFQPFKLDRDCLEKPGVFEVRFLLDQKVYLYGFQIDEKKILSEWLYFYPQKNQALLFKRELNETETFKLSGNGSGRHEVTYSYKFGSYFKGEKQKIISLTRSNALYLSVGAQFAHPVLERVYQWFNDFLEPGIIPGREINGGLTTKLMETDREMKKRMIRFLKSADLGIEGIKIHRLKNGGGSGRTVDIKMIHSAVSNDSEVLADIDLNSESMGTRRMYQLAGPLFHTLAHGGILIIDELEDSLHLHMLITLLAEFFENSRRSQIIFTTHNVQLLEEKLFRRDEIWFTEKGTDGATELFSLSDFKPKPRKDKSLRNGYLNGAFGALPLLGDLLSE
ncbi:MAG: ATP-binding protein [bacterium]|nr:ATP-binding protein [bacterium]